MVTRATLTSAIDHAVSACAPRAGSLAVTLFGDVVSVHGGTLWLGSLIEALALFGLNPRQVRTAVFRLARERWLSGSARGRRSYYQFTDFGRRQYAHAAERIYAGVSPPWDGWWTLLMTAGVTAVTRDELRRRLQWQGFGQLVGGVLAHPQARPAALAETLTELAVANQVVLWRARTEEAPAVHALVASAWRLDDIASRYHSFFSTFSTLHAAWTATTSPAPADAFRLRLLLVHEYRRILLGTTELPPALLGPEWPGHAARELTMQIYRDTHSAAVSHACAALHNANGTLPAPPADYFGRYGGLTTTSLRVAARSA